MVRTVCPAHNTKITCLMNFRNPTAAYNFTSLATLAVDVAISSSPTSQIPTKSSNYFATPLGDSACADMSEAEVATNPCLIDITGDTQSVEEKHISSNTKNKYRCSLVNFIFWILDCHPQFLVHQELLKHTHYMYIEFPRKVQ